MPSTRVEAVLLVDARGCHVWYRRAHLDADAAGQLYLRGQAWRGLAFQRTTETTRDGLPVYRSEQAAIGAPEALYVSRLYCPEGWREPWQLAELLAVPA